MWAQLTCPSPDLTLWLAGWSQTRGKFGLGAKMALIWSKMTTGLPFDIRSATARPRSPTISRYLLDIDIHK
jgi:DNA topoisomerase VI subunit B